MIILRQKEFAFGGFDWAFDSDGKKRNLDSEDERKFEAMKKKYPKEWEEFQRKQKEGRSSSSSRSNSGPRMYRNGSKVYTEEEMNKELSKARKRRGAAFGISLGTWGADMANAAIKSKIREDRKEDMDEATGHDKRMKRSDRAEIGILKTKSKKSKQALADALDEKKTAEERKKASKKYVRREAWDKAEEGAFRGANIGSSLGRIGGMMKEASDNFGKGTTGLGKNELYGTLIGTGVGAGVGALRWGLRSKKANKKIVEDLRNAKDKEKSKSKVKVAQGKMTESEFVNKHGGKEK